MDKSVTVIKYGGHAMEDEDLAQEFMQELARLADMGMRFVLVHGGGPMINDLLKRLNLKSSFCNGLRVTDAATLEAVEMALCGKVNKQVVRNLHKCGIKAVGISGEDGNLLKARQKDTALGRVGEITTVDSTLVSALLDAGFLPVVAPLALDNNGEPLNTNADTAAGALAGALKADHFVLLSNVPGILDSTGQLYSFLSSAAIAGLRQNGIIGGGMIPKVESCLAALGNGCKKALILNGGIKGSLSRYLLENDPAGTVIAQ